MSNEPKITIITPAYNAEDYIAEAIKSVQSQSFTDYEHIIIDDGSTDETLSIIKSYGRKDPHIVCVKQKNQGPSAARNTGINRAKGEYITFLDADDLYALETLAVAYSKMLEKSPDIIFYDFVYYRENHDVGPAPHKIDLDSGVVYSKKQLKGRIFNVFPILTCNKFIKRSLFSNENIQFNSTYARYEDVDFSIRATLVAETFAYADYVGYYYRVGNQNSETATNYKYATQLLQILIELNKIIVEKYPDLKQSFDNYAVGQTIANISTHDLHAEAQQEAFVFAKKKVIPGLGLGEVARDYFYNKDLFESFMAIKEGDFTSLLKCRLWLLQKHIESQQSSIRELNKQIKSTQSDYAVYRDSSELKVSKLKQEIEGIHNSFSWRLTKPLRVFRKNIKLRKHQLVRNRR